MGPHTQPGSLIAHNLTGQLCINFMKIDNSMDGKKNVLVLTDTICKFSQAFFTSNQKALTIAKLLVDK